MLKNLNLLIICILIVNITHVFATEKNYSLIIDQQSKQIQNLTNRINKLEQAFEKLINNTENSLQVSNDGKENTIASSEQKKSSIVENSSAQDIKTEYDLALAALKDGRYEEAEVKFSEFLQKHPKDKLRENALFWYGESFYQRKDYSRSSIEYLKAYKEYPKGIKSTDTLLKLAYSLGEIDKNAEACKILDKLNNEFPSCGTNISKQAKEARKKFQCK